MKRTKKTLTVVLNLLLPIVFALMVGGAFIMMLGKNPLEVYGFLLSKAVFDWEGFQNTLAFATPIIMTGLAIAVSFKAGIFNMGIEGQMYMGAFFATYLGFTITALPAFVHIPVCLLGGMLAGVAYAILPAILKSYFHVNEMVVTMMLNYVAIIFTRYLTNGPFTANVGYPATEAIQESAMLPRFNPRLPLTIAFILALVLVAAMQIIYKKTWFGYELESIGKQVEFSDAVGMRVDKKIVMIFVIAGLISGLAGACEMLGVHYRFTPGFSANPGLGWDGMLVALLASNNPVSVLFSAVFFGALKYGGTTMQSFIGVPNDVINIIQGALILFLSVRFIKEHSIWFDRFFKHLTGRTRAAAAAPGGKEGGR